MSGEQPVIRPIVDYLWFNTTERQEFIRITDDVERIAGESGVIEGMVLVSAMHITASVYVNDTVAADAHGMSHAVDSLSGAELGEIRRHIRMACHRRGCRLEQPGDALRDIVIYCRR